ncbi:MAG: hypothetical protein HYR62_11140 [Actinobacteria bacterium]|nr:hypothetical protein [Actinomycetota bacterium]MBI3686864.1 hypothetical protein [Actinomycetota bacterium]
MTTDTAGQLVDDYLARLDRAAHQLSRSWRVELVQEIGDFISSARAATATDEVAVRAMLDRLGTPEEIVAAARRNGSPESLMDARPAGIRRESAAVLMVTVGSLVGLVDPTVGLLGGILAVALLWRSRSWHLSEKMLGTLAVLAGPGLAVLASAFTIGTVPVIVLVMMPVAVWVVLLRRAMIRLPFG